jgi:hypothetical protein
MQSTPVATRPLSVYAFDPSQGHSLGNYMTINVPFEDLKPGPSGPYVDVIDYDSTNKRYYQAVDLDDRAILLKGGLDPSESDPRFHQQMVYAVSRETMHLFERALGRRLSWGYRRREPLRLFPHAMQEANAFYDRSIKGIVFGYFAASADDPGNNLPNQTVFTCLSHDIIAHETTHAILDGQRRYFMQDTNPDVLAFHEAFADIVALFQHFSYRDALYDTMVRTGGYIYRAQIDPVVKPSGDGPAIAYEMKSSNPLIELAKQFGESMGRRAALRSALGTPPSSRALESTTEPHDRGAILVAAVFDAYFTSLQNKTADLFRIARAGGAQIAANDIHPDLASRLCDEATRLAQHFVTMCIRAIDYCPPVDITFGDYLRALVTADADLYPDDPFDYREALIEAFRLRGIHPDNVISMSEDSLRWRGVDPNQDVPVCLGLQFDLMNGQTPAMEKSNGRALSNFAAKYAAELRLVPNLEKQPYAHSFHPLIRTNDGFSRVQIVTELMQRKDVPSDPSDPKSPKIRRYGGATVHLDADGGVRYIIHKGLEEWGRDERQQAHFERNLAARGSDTYIKDRDALDTTVNFAAAHRGY